MFYYHHYYFIYDDCQNFIVLGSFFSKIRNELEEVNFILDSFHSIHFNFISFRFISIHFTSFSSIQFHYNFISFQFIYFSPFHFISFIPSFFDGFLSPSICFFFPECALFVLFRFFLRQCTSGKYS